MRVAQRTAANVSSLPAPVGGWNARDSLANMEVTDAVNLDNFFPTTYNCVLRGGYITHSTLPDNVSVKTLMVYNGAATTKMFAIGGTKVYDVTTTGGTATAVVTTGITNATWEYTNISTSGGNFLFAVNGSDKPLLYDGTTWTRLDSTSTPAITGITTTKLINVTLFKNRLWFIEKDTLRAWYLPALSVGGAAVFIDLSAIAKFGGHLVDLDTWTLDAGYGMDDNLAFITSNGEVIVYRGTDPDSLATWSLAGVWKLGSPVGTRCMLKYGGDLLILTYDGLMPMAQSLQSSRLDPRVALSNKIQGAITKATTTYGSHTSEGWQIFYSAKNNAVWINIPVADGQQEQYVMNTITTSWCRFTGWGAFCWETYNDDPYFGGTGKVYKAWDDGYKDGDNNITAFAQQAFNYFDSRGVKKYFTRARPSLFTDGTPTTFIGMNVDFQLNDTAAAISYAPTTTTGTWGSSTWDSAVWGGAVNVQNNWQGITGIGYCGSLQFKSASSGLQLEWASTDIVYQTGWAGI